MAPVCVHVYVTDYNNISKFLNRVLGIEVDLQNLLFRYFTDTLTSVILEQKRRGAWDMGILGASLSLSLLIYCRSYYCLLIQYVTVTAEGSMHNRILNLTLTPYRKPNSKQHTIFNI